MSENIIIYITNVIYVIKVLSISFCFFSFLFFVFSICDYEDSKINSRMFKMRFKINFILFAILLILSIFFPEKDVCYDILSYIIK